MDLARRRTRNVFSQWRDYVRVVHWVNTPNARGGYGVTSRGVASHASLGTFRCRTCIGKVVVELVRVRLSWL